MQNIHELALALLARVVVARARGFDHTPREVVTNERPVVWVAPDQDVFHQDEGDAVALAQGAGLEGERLDFVHGSGLLCFGLGKPMFARFCFVQCSKSGPELIADAGVVVAGKIADAGLRTPAFLRNLYLGETPVCEVEKDG